MPAPDASSTAMARSPGPETGGAGSPALKNRTGRTSRPVPDRRTAAATGVGGTSGRGDQDVRAGARHVETVAAVGPGDRAVQTAFHISAAFLVAAALVAAFVLKQKGWESVAEADAAVGMAEG